jgi:hypothetical protein
MDNELEQSLGLVGPSKSDLHAAASSDPFSLSNLKLSQNFGETLGVKKLLTKVPVRKPDHQWFVRVHPSEENRLVTATLKIKEERDGSYLVDRSLWDELGSEIKPTILLLAINRQDVPFLWDIPMPDAQGKHHEFHASALNAALNYATKKWIRIRANIPLGGYDVSSAEGDLSQPQWPELSFQEILTLAYRERFIRSMDHPVIQKLRGLV